MRNSILSLFGLALSLLIPYSVALGQNQALYWYFGQNAGLNFHNQPPTALSDGELYSSEGCAVVSNTSGDLLFYTNGQTVWNRFHDIMENGDSLSGSPTSTQSALVLPDPGNLSLFYLFTTGGDPGSQQLSYSVLDLSANFGAGRVDSIRKNVFLYSPVTEKLSAAWHADKQRFWLIAHERNTSNYLSFLLSDTGLVHSPVISPAGFAHTLGIGQMKASPDGKWIASSVLTGFVELSSFNDTTGTVSIHLALDGLSVPYGVEFSPNSSKLYYSTYTNGIWQLDLNGGDPGSILSSREQIFFQQDRTLQALQNTPDGRIFVAVLNADSLDVIGHPDSAGMASNYQKAGIYLGGNKSVSGLPNFFPPHFRDLSPATALFPAVQARNLHISPNPVHDNMVRISGLNHRMAVEIRLMNMTGKTVWKESLLPGTDQLFFPENIGKGIYFLEIRTAEGSETHKILLQ